jgi:hypothetical protein
LGGSGRSARRRLPAERHRDVDIKLCALRIRRNLPMRSQLALKAESTACRLSAMGAEADISSCKISRQGERTIGAVDTLGHPEEARRDRFQAMEHAVKSGETFAKLFGMTSTLPKPRQFDA